jgi:hypothetical protein
MKTLEKELSYQGRTLRQLKREGNVAIYDVRNAGNTLYGFEVIIVRILPEETIMGKPYPEREAYPSSAKNSDDWGKIAWSYGAKDKIRALACYNGLLKRQSEHGGVLKISDLMGAEGKHSGGE